MLNYSDAIGAARERLSALRNVEEQALEYDVAEHETIEHEWGWVFFWNTRLFLDTLDHEHAVGPRAPLFVNKEDGSVTVAGSLDRWKNELKRYERTIGARPWWRVW